MEWAAATAVAGATAAAFARGSANKSDALENLDLSRYVKKLVSEDGLGSAEHARDAIALYKGFLVFSASRGTAQGSRTRRPLPMSTWSGSGTSSIRSSTAPTAVASSEQPRTPTASMQRRTAESRCPRRPSSPPADAPQQSSSAAPEQLVEDEDLEWLGTAVATELPLKQDKCKHLDGPLTKIAMPADPAAAVREYKRFQRMMIEDRGKWYTPSKLVDELWHRHMLDSKKYAAFCQRVAGYYLHHTPYYGEPSTFESWVAELRGHDPAGTLEAYQSKWAEAPPVQIWGTKGESGGGCSGGGGGGGEVPTTWAGWIGHFFCINTVLVSASQRVFSRIPSSSLNWFNSLALVTPVFTTVSIYHCDPVAALIILLILLFNLMFFCKCTVWQVSNVPVFQSVLL